MGNYPPADYATSVFSSLSLTFDKDENWVNGVSSGINMNSVALHEIGHTLGVGHSNDLNAVMYRTYSPNKLTLTQDDIAGLWTLYQPKPVTSFTFSSYTNVGLGVSPCPSETFFIYPELQCSSSSILQGDWQVTGCTITSSGSTWIQITAPSGIYAGFTVKYRYRTAGGWSTWSPTLNGSTRNCAGGEDPYSLPLPGGNSSNYSASPNPVNSVLTVTLGSFSSLSSSYNIKLYNANGVAVRQVTSQGENVELDVSTLPNGYYYLHIFSGNDPQPDMRIIIVQH